MPRFTLRALLLLMGLAAVCFWPWAEMHRPDRMLAKAEHLARKSKAGWDAKFDEDGHCAVTLWGPNLSVKAAKAVSAASRIKCLYIRQDLTSEASAELSKSFRAGWSVSRKKGTYQYWMRKTADSASK